jgi:hypothetical protein
MPHQDSWLVGPKPRLGRGDELVLEEIEVGLRPRAASNVGEIDLGRREVDAPIMALDADQ